MASAEASDRVVGEDGELGLAVRAAGGHHERVARLDGVVGAGRGQHGRAGRPGQAGVEREHRVARHPTRAAGR